MFSSLRIFTHLYCQSDLSHELKSFGWRVIINDDRRIWEVEQNSISCSLKHTHTRTLTHTNLHTYTHKDTSELAFLLGLFSASLDLFALFLHYSLSIHPPSFPPPSSSSREVPRTGNHAGTVQEFSSSLLRSRLARDTMILHNILCTSYIHITYIHTYIRIPCETHPIVSGCKRDTVELERGGWAHHPLSQFFFIFFFSSPTQMRQLLGSSSTWEILRRTHPSHAQGRMKWNKWEMEKRMGEDDALELRNE